jgi:hypothetical protein
MLDEVYARPTISADSGSRSSTLVIPENNSGEGKAQQ